MSSSGRVGVVRRMLRPRRVGSIAMAHLLRSGFTPQHCRRGAELTSSNQLVGAAEGPRGARREAKRLVTLVKCTGNGAVRLESCLARRRGTMPTPVRVVGLGGSLRHESTSRTALQ